MFPPIPVALPPAIEFVAFGDRRSLKQREHRMRHSHSHKAAAMTSLFIVGIIFVYGQAQSASRQAAAPHPEHVIMISIDGMVPDYYTAPERVGLRAPNLALLKNGGAYAEGVEGIYPTVTYPLHTTLVTGVRPAIHGIVQNRIFEAPTDPQTRSWYWYASALKAETLWGLARKAGLVTLLSDGR
jgi:predicted AlkP superfamily pyrophosphatase or phosphodiesterase